MSIQSDIVSYRSMAEHTRLPLFCRPYWLDACSVDKEWDVVHVGNAWWPYHVSHHRLLMPQLTQCLDPIGPASDQAEALAEALDRCCRSRHLLYASTQGMWPDQLCSALASRGFAVRERVTYRIPAGKRREEVISGYSENKRRQLKKAHGLSEVTLDVDTFYAFHRTCLAQRGRKINYSLAYAHSLLGSALAHGNARLIGAADEAGRLLAAVGLVYDEQVCYYLLPTYSESDKRSGAMAWLTTEAIVWATESGRIFDFEGSMVPSIARSYREFGGQPMTYHSAEKYYSRLYRLIREGRL